MFQLFEDDDLAEEDIECEEEDDDEDEESDDVEGFTVENAYLEEKEDACCALGELSENTR